MIGSDRRVAASSGTGPEPGRRPKGPRSRQRPLRGCGRKARDKRTSAREEARRQASALQKRRFRRRARDPTAEIARAPDCVRKRTFCFQDGSYTALSQCLGCMQRGCECRRQVKKTVRAVDLHGSGTGRSVLAVEIQAVPADRFAPPKGAAQGAPIPQGTGLWPWTSRRGLATLERFRLSLRPAPPSRSKRSVFVCKGDDLHLKMNDAAKTAPRRPDDRSEENRILAWRAETLERAGYDGYIANALAGAREVDLHFAVRLREVGCPTRTALRILL